MKRWSLACARRLARASAKQGVPPTAVSATRASSPPRSAVNALARVQTGNIGDQCPGSRGVAFTKRFDVGLCVDRARNLPLCLRTRSILGLRPERTDPGKCVWPMPVNQPADPGNGPGGSERCWASHQVVARCPPGPWRGRQNYRPRRRRWHRTLQTLPQRGSGARTERDCPANCSRQLECSVTRVWTPVSEAAAGDVMSRAVGLLVRSPDRATRRHGVLAVPTQRQKSAGKAARARRPGTSSIRLFTRLPGRVGHVGSHGGTSSVVGRRLGSGADRSQIATKPALMACQQVFSNSPRACSAHGLVVQAEVIEICAVILARGPSPGSEWRWPPTGGNGGDVAHVDPPSAAEVMRGESSECRRENWIHVRRITVQFALVSGGEGCAWSRVQFLRQWWQSAEAASHRDDAQMQSLHSYVKAY